MLKNYMEDVVFSLLDQVVNDMDICKCEKCKLDIAAITLNHLQPKYVVNEKGELYSKVNNFKAQSEIDVIKEITKAALLVSKNPQH